MNPASGTCLFLVFLDKNMCIHNEKIIENTKSTIKLIVGKPREKA
jgi:hypothetical protein